MKDKVINIGLTLALLSLTGCAKPPCTLTSIAQSTVNGDTMMTWTINPTVPVAVKVTCTDPHYDTQWSKQPSPWSSGSYSLLWGKRRKIESPRCWDVIAFSVGTESNGEYRFRVQAEARDRSRTGGISGGGSSGCSRDKPQKPAFYSLRKKGPIPLGTALGRFVLQSEKGHSVTGEVTVVSVSD